MSHRATAVRLLLALSLCSSIGSMAMAQSVTGGIITPTLPAPGSGSVVTVPAQSSAAEQQLYNFVAFPVGTINTPTGTQQLEYRFRLPVVFANPQVPTDVTGVGGSLGHAQGLRERILGPDRNFLPDSQGMLVARDVRYNFTGIWHPLVKGQTQVAMAPGVRTMPVVVPRTSGALPKAGQVQIMPTGVASYVVSAANEVTLKEGALLLKGGNAPLYVLMPLATDTAVVRIDRGTFAMVSNLGGHISVTNLSDTHNDSCVVYLTDRTRKTYGEMPVRIGYMVEVYPNVVAAGENRVTAHTVLNQLRLSNGYTVETTRVNYPLAMKRFNLTRSLDAGDMARLIKTAAAVAYLDRQRAVNGTTTPAQ